MKRVFLFIVLFNGLWMEAQTFAPVPISNYSTGIDNAYYNAGAMSAPTLYLWTKTPFRGGANNCVIMAVSSQSTLTVSTPTDDHGETWVAGSSVSASNVTWQLFYVLGTTAGTSKITVATTGTANNNYPIFLGAILTEVENCNSSVVGGHGTMNTTATGSGINLTLSAAPNSGDMVWAAFMDASGAPLPYLSTVNPGSGFTALSSSLSFGKIAEYSTSTTNTTVPVIYSGSDTILGVAVVIKQGAAGTGPPSTMYIDHYQVEQSSGNHLMNFPCSGNLIAGLQSNGNGAYISSLASNGAATWNSGVQATNTQVNINAQIFYGYNATCSSSMTVTPTWTGTPGSPGTEIALVSVSNANASPFDTSHSSVGNQTVNTNWTSDSITPSAQNEMVFNLGAINFHTITGTVEDANSHTPTPLMAVDSEADDASGGNTRTPNSTLDEDNAYAVYTNTSDVLPITFIYTSTANGTNPPPGVSYWSSVSAAFKPSSSSPPAPPTNLQVTVQ